MLHLCQTIRKLHDMTRKITLLTLLLCIAVCAQAQIYVGGNIGITTSSSDSRVGVVIAPEVGYNINPNFTVGGTLSYRSLQNSFGLTPYLRGYLCNIQDRFRIFLSLQAPLRFAFDYQSYGAYLRPGVSFRIGDGVWMMAHIGALGYSYTRSGGVGSGGWSAQLNSNTINIGFCFGLGI